MHDHEPRSDITSTLTKETDFIRLINEHYPDRSDIRHFLSSGMNHNGLLVFRWKFHNNLILQIGWNRNNLQIFQRLRVSGSEVSSSFPVTWNGFADNIPFDGSGEAMLTGQVAHLLWTHVREHLGTYAERS